MAAPRTDRGALPPRLRSILRGTFGLTRLREGQQAVIDRVLAGGHTLAVMPTGAGKSLCYQLPALALEGRTVVVSPLISLMKDQCDKLCELGVRAVQVHSALTAGERDETLAAVADGSAKVVFATPERLADPEFLALMKDAPTSLLVVDEAHCIAQWGHDFRPAFLDVGLARPALGRPTVLALTATASGDVIADVSSQLGIPRDGVINTGTFRANLHYRVEHVADERAKLDRAVAYVQATPGPGLVYTATIKAAEAVSEALARAGESVGLYHGRLPAAERHAVQEAFMSGERRVVVATNAFGLGIDKPDTRFVLHYQMPGSLDAYYQESGRGGRDGETAECTLLFLKGDKAVQQFFLAGRYPTAQDLDAIYRRLHEPDRWTVETLAEALHQPLAKVRVVISLLKQGRVLAADRVGLLRLLKPDLVEAELTQLQAMYMRKREQERDTLERMVAYALTGQCRWSALLAHFDEPAAFERCGTCDNCVRLAGFTAARAAREDEAVEVAAAAPVPFVPGEVVRVRRYGAGRVVASDASSVTVAFDGGEQRSFLPDFVKGASKGARQAARRTRDEGTVAGHAARQVAGEETAEATIQDAGHSLAPRDPAIVKDALTAAG